MEAYRPPDVWIVHNGEAGHERHDDTTVHWVPAAQLPERLNQLATT